MVSITGQKNGAEVLDAFGLHLVTQEWDMNVSLILSLI